MAKVIIESSVKNDKVDRNRLALSNAIKQFNNKDIEIIIQDVKRKRSNRQNRYYWGIIVKIWQNTIFEEWGEYRNTQAVHEFLKYNCNYKELVNEKTGEILREVLSTSDSNTLEMEKYQEKCRQLIFEMFNIIVPLPGEIIELDL